MKCIGQQCPPRHRPRAMNTRSRTTAGKADLRAEPALSSASKMLARAQHSRGLRAKRAREKDADLRAEPAISSASKMLAQAQHSSGLLAQRAKEKDADLRAEPALSSA